MRRIAELSPWSLALLVILSVSRSVSGGQISVIRPACVASIEPGDGSQGSRLIAKFDLSAVGTDRQIDFAQLIFSARIGDVEDAAPVVKLEVFPLTTDWEQSAVGWSTPWSEPGGDIDPTDKSTNWVMVVNTSPLWIDVSRLARAWKAGEQANHGVLLKISDLTPARFQTIDMRGVELKVWHHAKRNP
jgi:hypothetical protein